MLVSEITSGTILKLCRKIEARGTLETAARVKVLSGEIFRYAIATDRADNDPTTALAGALASRTPKHMAALYKFISSYGRKVCFKIFRVSFLQTR